MTFKSLLGAAIIIFSAQSFAAFTDLQCNGSYKWKNGGTEKVSFSARLNGPGRLKKIIEVRTDKNGVATTFESTSMKADSQFMPSSEFADYDRYNLKGGNGFVQYYLLLPKDLTTKPLVKGFQQRVVAKGYETPDYDSHPDIPLNCQIVDGELKKLVANDIEALAWDTVNEGSQTATVIWRGDEPHVSCKISNNKTEAGKYWAFCFVDFKVEFEYSEDKAERTCDLLYSYDPANMRSSLVADEDKEMQCLEYLGESE